NLFLIHCHPCLGNSFDFDTRLHLTLTLTDSGGHRVQSGSQCLVRQETVDRLEQFGLGAAVCVQVHSQSFLLHSSGIVVLVGEQWHYHDRFAECKRLGDGVVATVTDHQVDHRQDGGLRQEGTTAHVRR